MYLKMTNLYGFKHETPLPFCSCIHGVSISNIHLGSSMWANQ